MTVISYHQQTDTIVLISQESIIQAQYYVASMIFAEVSLFLHAIYSSADLQVRWRINSMQK